MHPPVGHQASGIIPKPAKIKMKAVFIKWSFGSRSQPHFVIYAGWNRGIGLYWYGLHPSLVSPTFYQTDIAQFARLNIIDGIRILGAASLPLPHLHDLSITLRGF